MKPKLTEDLIQEMARLKRDGLTNKDICRAVGIHEATLYRWVGKPTTRLHRALCEELKKAESDYKAQLLNTIRAAALAKNSYWTAAGVAPRAQVPRRVRARGPQGRCRQGHRCPRPSCWRDRGRRRG